MTVYRKSIPDGFKYYITCKDKKGQKYFQYGAALSYEYPPSDEYPAGKIEDTKTYNDIIKDFTYEVEEARKSNTIINMQSGPKGERKDVDPHQIDLTTVIIENYDPKRFFDYFE